MSPESEFDKLFRTFSREAWRWECQGTYREPDEDEPWLRWKRGESDDLEWLHPWLADVQAATGAGKSLARVRVFDEPLTEYQRWQLDISPENIAAGEDLCVLSRSSAHELELPGHDFWLFDDTSVVLMHFDREQYVGPEIITEPGEVARYSRWKTLAWEHAVPFTQYVEQMSQRSR